MSSSLTPRHTNSVNFEHFQGSKFRFRTITKISDSISNEKFLHQIVIMDVKSYSTLRVLEKGIKGPKSFSNYLGIHSLTVTLKIESQEAGRPYRRVIITWEGSS